MKESEENSVDPQPRLAAKDHLDAWLARLLVAWVELVCAHATLVVSGLLLVTVGLLGYTVMNLGLNSDNVKLMGEDLPARKNHEAFARLFPNLENGLFLVIDARTPELARYAAISLTEALADDDEFIEDVYLPGGGEFFERNGLLYRSPEELDEFGDQIARVQPIIAALERDPSLANMAELITMGLEASERDGTGIDEWPDVLDRVSQATIAVFAEFPVAISWEEMLLRGSSIESVTRRVVVVHPRLDFSDFLAAAGPMEHIRATARELELTPENGVEVRITGNPALNSEEMYGILMDVLGGGVACFVIVAILLRRALRRFKLVAATLIALLVGLVWTAAFAAAAIGHLNLVSMAFAVLFIGLGVDFGIHLCMRYGDALRTGHDHLGSLRIAMEQVGSSLVICSVTTAIGFFVFVPTQYLGVAELGLIAGVGMFMILFHTLTLLPALLTCWLQIRPDEIPDKPFRFANPHMDFIKERPGTIVLLALLLGVASLSSFGKLRFDANVINMRNPNTESVQAFNDLLEQAGMASPWFINSVAPDLETAVERARAFDALDTVEMTLTLQDFVPEDQDEKLDIIEDIAFLMDAPGSSMDDTTGARTSVAAQVAALRRLHAFLGRAEPHARESALQRSILNLRRRLQEFFNRLEQTGDPELALADLETILLANLPEQIERLRHSLEASEIHMDDLPAELRDRMLSDDGHARIQVFPRESMTDEASFERFVSSAMKIDPKVTGVAVNLLQFGHAIRDSFRQALSSAIVVIWLILWLLWHRIKPVALATVPLLLGSLFTCAFMAIFDMPFQFGNVIVIPLLLGIGVDSGIHLVHRAESIHGADEDLMGTTTARAVFYSALTTTISFGSLAFSSHRGVSSLGVLLSAGMLFTVVCNLIVLPALIQLDKQRGG